MEPTNTKLYELVRAQLQHEDTLITQRLSWLIASQSFLFSAYAITLNAPVMGRSPTFVRQQEVLSFLLPMVASSISLLILVTIVAGQIAMDRLHRHYALQVPTGAPPGYPEVQGSRITRRLGASAPLLLPVLFTAVWVFLLVTARR